MKKSSFVLVATLVALGFFAGVSSYNAGIKRGKIMAGVERLPFDLALNLMMYEMSEYIYSGENDNPRASWRPDSIKVFLYANLQFYNEIALGYFSDTGKTEAFQQNLERAREIVVGVDLVELGDALEAEGVKRAGGVTAAKGVASPESSIEDAPDEKR